ncbi:hypothetical protein ACP4OV_027176 [Aristida adscensionis]
MHKLEIEEKMKLRETVEHRLAAIHKKPEGAVKSSSKSAYHFTDST